MFITSLLFSLSVLAAEPTQAPIPDFPEYKNEIEKVYDKMVKPEEKPNDISKSFQEMSSKKINEISLFIRNKKKELFDEQAKRRKEFEDLAKKELSDWRLAHPKESASNFMREQGERRKVFMDKMRNDKALFENKLEEKRFYFQSFLKNAKKEFQSKFNSYVTSFNAAMKSKKSQENPLKKEFKEIPKGRGTVLAPGKDPHKD
jgi:hypothetical protein